MTWPECPVIHEVNTAVWLKELSRDAGRRLTLADLSAAHWAAVTPPGIDAIWLMGVWERSPAGLSIANDTPALWADFRNALPDVQTVDVIGSPYCVQRYVVDAAFGGPDALAAARAALADRGVRLVLDYVPNHVAPDHPWVTENPELFIQGAERDVAADPAAWMTAAGRVLARGRDPYFPPWPDVVQLNAFSEALRASSARVLADIVVQCDGIRCDMAMLMTNRVFAATWGPKAGAKPDREFWPEVIGALRAEHAETVLIAEAYWDMEWELQNQGFDFCYDKRLYDRIVTQDPRRVRDHLCADLDYQAKLLRFLENHDEPRIATRLGFEAEMAAAVAVATLPGGTLWHEGQFEGRRVRPPVFLSRRPDEQPNQDLATWYERLLATVSYRDVKCGRWQLLETTGWPDNQSCDNVLAWSWSGGDAGHVVVVNLSAQPAQARIHLDADGEPPAGNLRFADLLAGGVYFRDRSEVADLGLYVDLQPWESYLLAVDRVPLRPEAPVSP
jgi:hypothetical protein